jgi:hypothetical protein
VDGVPLDVVAFQPDTAVPTFRIQADPDTHPVPVLHALTIDDVLKGDNQSICHFGLGSREHFNEQPKQCGRLVGILPKGAIIDGMQAGGFGELDAYGHSDGDLGGPVYIPDPNGGAVYVLGMVVSASGYCDWAGCRRKILFLPVHDIERALKAHLYTSS